MIHVWSARRVTTVVVRWNSCQESPAEVCGGMGDMGGGGGVVDGLMGRLMGWNGWMGWMGWDGLVGLYLTLRIPNITVLLVLITMSVSIMIRF